jgi:hypothetical protein
MLCGRVEIPHPVTISRDVREIFTLTKVQVIRVLKVWFLSYWLRYLIHS